MAMGNAKPGFCALPSVAARPEREKGTVIMKRIQMENGMCRGIGVLGVALMVGLGSAVAQQSGAGGGVQPGSQTGTNPSMTPGSTTSNNISSMSGMNMNKASAQDKDFAKTAMGGGMFEVQAAQLALQKSNSDDVKQFAQMMIDDHTKLNNQMMPIAQQAGVKPPTKLPAKQEAIYKKLQGLSGDAFDQAYIKAMLQDHKEDVQDFQQESSSGQLTAEKDAAQQGLPIIQMHLDKAKQLAQAHNVSMGM